MDTASSSNQHSAVSQKTLAYANNTVTISGHSGGAAGCDTASQGEQFLKLQRNMSSALEDEVDMIPSQWQEQLTCDTVSHLRRKKSSVRPQGQALTEPAHTVRFHQSYSLGFMWLWLLLQRAVHFWWWYCGAHSSQTHCRPMWPTQKPSRASSHRRDRQTLACLTGKSKSSIIELSPH